MRYLVKPGSRICTAGSGIALVGREGEGLRQHAAAERGQAGAGGGLEEAASGGGGVVVVVMHGSGSPCCWWFVQCTAEVKRRRMRSVRVAPAWSDPRCMEQASGFGPLQLLTAVGFSTPFALRYRRARLSSSKPSCRMPQGLRYLSPNGIFLYVRPEPVEGQAELVFPIALSLSKGAFVPHTKGFDRLSPNGDNAGLPSIPQDGRNSHLSPNGSVADLERRQRAENRP